MATRDHNGLSGSLAALRVAWSAKKAEHNHGRGLVGGQERGGDPLWTRRRPRARGSKQTRAGEPATATPTPAAPPANPRNRDANATHRRRRDPTPILTDAVPFHISPQFWSEGYREGIEEGKKATVQRGFNVGFREGAAAGVAYGQVRGAAVSVGIFAGQVPGSGGWADAVRGAAGIVQRMRPADAAREAKADHERLLRSESRDGDPGTPTRSEQVVNNELQPEPPSDRSDGDSVGEAPPKRGRGEDEDGTFAGKMRGARDELERAGFELRDVELR